LFGFEFVSFFLGDVVSGIGFWPFWIRLLGPGPKLLHGSISLRILLETRLESKFFEPLIDFLGFWVQKLWPTNNKIIN